MNPAVIESSSAPDREKPIYAYRIDGDHKAVRLVFRTAGGAYWGVEETDWEDAPILGDKSFRHVLGGRAYDFYYNGPKLHMIVLRQDGVDLLGGQLDPRQRLQRDDDRDGQGAEAVEGCKGGK